MAGDDFVRVFGPADIRFSKRLGDLTRSLSFADGSLCETSDNDAIDRYLARAGRDYVARQVHVLERGWHWVTAAVVILAVTGWLVIVVAVPLMAAAVAFSLPPEVDDQLGRDGLELLDEMVFETTRLDPARQDALRGGFGKLALQSGLDQQLRLEFRSGEDIGANAFALPSATIVITDELVDLAQNDNEILAVLAHEIGHVDGRHSLRLILQDSITVLIFAVMLGDISSVTGLAGALPAVLLQTRYSRRFETEADDYALALMQTANISPHSFADILRRLEAAHDGGSMPAFLSSHPATAERVQRFQH